MRSIQAALMQIAMEQEQTRPVLMPLLIQAGKWNTLPKGWTPASVEKFWETLTGDSKHKVTKCISEMDGKVSDPGAFCASLADKVLGPEWRSKKGSDFGNAQKGGRTMTSQENENDYAWVADSHSYTAWDNLSLAMEKLLKQLSQVHKDIRTHIERHLPLGGLVAKKMGIEADLEDVTRQERVAMDSLVRLLKRREYERTAASTDRLPNALHTDRNTIKARIETLNAGILKRKRAGKSPDELIQRKALLEVQLAEATQTKNAAMRRLGGSSQGVSKRAIGPSLKIPVKVLPAIVKKVLADVGFKKREISVSIADWYSMYSAGDDGSKGFTALVALGSRQTAIEWGAWGGGGLGARVSPVDDVNTPRKSLPQHVVVVQGQIGAYAYASLRCTEDTYKTLTGADSVL